MANQLSIRTERKNCSVHTVEVREPQLLAMVEQAVAAQLGIDLAAGHVKARSYASTYREGSLGTSKASIEVEIVVDHSQDDAAG